MTPPALEEERAPSPRAYRFGAFRLEPQTGRLLQDGTAVSVEPIAFRLLLFLVENRERLVTKQELFDEVWEGRFVSEHALTRAVARLRSVLGDEARNPRYIETAHSRGYRFLVQAEPIFEPATDDSAGYAEEAVGPPARQYSRLFWASLGVAGLLLLAVALVRIVAIRSDPGHDGSSSRVQEIDSRTADRTSHRLAVLPMVNLSGDDEYDYFVDGLTEQMISVLSRIEGLRVIARTTIMGYRNTPKSVAEIGQELAVGSVLEGSVRREGDRVRITVQLIDTASEVHLWSQEYDRSLTSLFAIQGEIAVRVAEALQTSIPPQVIRQIERGPANDQTAYDYYLRGRRFYREHSRSGNENAIQLFQRALALEPGFALAEAGLANGYAIRLIRFGGGDPSRQAALRHAQRALELDPNLPEAHKALGIVHLEGCRIGEALDENLRALELNPDYDEAAYNAASDAYHLGLWDQAVELQLRDAVRPMGRATLAIYLFMLGLEGEGRSVAGSAMDQEPLTGYLNGYLVQRDLIAGRIEAARWRAQRLIAAQPDWPRVWRLAGEVELIDGEMELSIERFEKALETANGDDPEAALRIALIEWQTGTRAAAEERLSTLEADERRLIAEGHGSWEHPWRLAAVEAIRGNTDAALDWYKMSVELGRRRYAWDAIEPTFASLRTHAEFQRQLFVMEKSVAAMRVRARESLRKAWPPVL